MTGKGFLFIGMIGMVLVGTAFCLFFYEQPSADNNAVIAQADTGIERVASPVPDLSEEANRQQISVQADMTPAGKIETIPSVAVKSDAAEAVADNSGLEEPDPENDHKIVDKEQLRKRFPDKLDLIPITDDEIEARKQVIKKSYDKFIQILANKASAEEIHDYYDEKTKLTKDRIEILEYSISQFGEQLSEDGKRRQQNTLMILENQLLKIPQRREQALARLKKLETGDEDS